MVVNLKVRHSRRGFDSRRVHQEEIMLEDKGSYYLDTEAKTEIVVNADGEIVGYYYCPYIPKFLVDGLDQASIG